MCLSPRRRLPACLFPCKPKQRRVSCVGVSIRKECWQALVWYSSNAEQRNGKLQRSERQTLLVRKSIHSATQGKDGQMERNGSAKGAADTGEQLRF